MGERSAEAVLSELWDLCADDAFDTEGFQAMVSPFDRRFPGLAPARPPLGSPAVHRALKAVGRASLALVPVTRGADVPAAIGWTGPVNHTNEVWKLSAVLRSWEERFGALLVGIGFDTLALAVRRPPVGDDAVAVAAEHFAFCLDNIAQGAGSIGAYARHLRGSAVWTFWWD